MTRYILIALALLLIGGCAGSIKYEHAKRAQRVPCYEMEPVNITAR
jgi:hypothetical protein